MLSLLSFAQVYSVLLSFSQFCSVLHSFAQSICIQVCSVCSVLLKSAQFRSVLHSFVQSCSVSLSFAQIIFTQVCLVRSASLYCLSMCVYTLLPTLSMKFFGLVWVWLHSFAYIIHPLSYSLGYLMVGALFLPPWNVRCPAWTWRGAASTGAQNMLFILSRMAKGTVQYRGGTAYTPAASGPCSLYYCTSTAMAFERL